MKHLTFAAIILCGLVVSCTPTATPQPQVTLERVTTQIPTTIPTLAETPTHTPTLALTESKPTATPRATNTPDRSSPTPTLVDQSTRGTQIFFDSFASGKVEGHWAFTAKTSTITEFVPDPTDKNKQVMRVRITGDPQKADWDLTGQYWYTGYTSWENTQRTPIHAFEVEVYFPSDGWSEYTGVGLLGAHGLTNTRGSSSDVIGFEIGDVRRGIFQLYAQDKDGKSTRQEITIGNIRDKWIKLRFELTDTEVIYLINGKIVGRKVMPFQPKDIHAGLLRAIATPKDSKAKLGDNLLNRNFGIEKR
jgi:hypothetical protein